MGDIVAPKDFRHKSYFWMLLYQTWQQHIIQDGFLNKDKEAGKTYGNFWKFHRDVYNESL